MLISAIIFCIFASVKNRIQYQDECRYIYIRQVAAANWLKNNTPENAVIGTHDVGAIAYYSGRKIIDIVGLINPEFIPKINAQEFVPFVKEELDKKNVTYVAFLKEWFQVVNQPLLFQGGDNGIEIMEIYQYFPSKTHILSVKINNTIMYAGQLLVKKQIQQAIDVLKNLVNADPNSSLTYYMLSYAYILQGDAANAEINLKKTIEIYPSYWQAVGALSNIYKSQNKIAEAKTVLNNYLLINPSDSTILKLQQSLETAPNQK